MKPDWTFKISWTECTACGVPTLYAMEYGKHMLCLNCERDVDANMAECEAYYASLDNEG